MNIAEIMERDIREEERREAAERAARGEGPRPLPIGAILMWTAVVLLLMCLAFVAGIHYESARALEEHQRFESWLDSVEQANRLAADTL